MVAVYTSTTQLSFSSESPTGLQSIRSMMKVICDVEFLIIFYSLSMFWRSRKELIILAYTLLRLSNGRRMSNFRRRNRLGPFRLELIVSALYL